MKLKRKMTKKEVAEAKILARRRKNKRLSTGEAARVMASLGDDYFKEVSTKKAFTSNGRITDTIKDHDFGSFDIMKDHPSALILPTTNRSHILQKPYGVLMGKPIKSLHSRRGFDYDPTLERKMVTQKIMPEINNDLVKAMAKELKVVEELDPRRAKFQFPKKNRRLSKRQYESLMKKINEIGINDDKYKIVDLNDKGKYKIDELIQLCLTGLMYEGLGDVRVRYRKLTDKKKFKTAEKLAILSYLMNVAYVNKYAAYFSRNEREDITGIRDLSKEFTIGSNTVDEALRGSGIFRESILTARLNQLYSPKVSVPFCLIPKKERINEVRNEAAKLKKKGDVKIRPFRIIPDKEYLKEREGKRTRFDSFDKLSNDKKIQWARYANLVLGVKLAEKFCMSRLDKLDCENITFSMKYACKMMSISEFKGIFAGPLWVLYRIDKFSSAMTDKEHKMFFNMALNHLGIQKTKAIPVLDTQEAAKRLEPILREFKLYGKYSDRVKQEGRDSALKVAGDLLLGIK